MTTHAPIPKHAEERLARSIAARLTDSSDDLPHSITERLRAARVQAVSRRKMESVRAAPIAAALAGSADIQLGSPRNAWWNRLASALALAALVAGLIGIADIQDDLRANELAEVDAELLTDDLPPSAYTDPGFAQYLRSNPNR